MRILIWKLHVSCNKVLAFKKIYKIQNRSGGRPSKTHFWSQFSILSTFLDCDCKNTEGTHHRGRLGTVSQNFQVYFINIIFLRNKIKKMYNKAKKVWCYYICFLILHCLLVQKNGNWKMAQGCRLSRIRDEFTACIIS